MLFEEPSVLKDCGGDLAATLLGSALMCIVFGAYIGVSAVALHLLGQRSLRQLPSLILFIIQISLILTSVWQVVAMNGNMLGQLFDILVNPKLDPEQQLEDRIIASSILNKTWSAFSRWPGNINLLVGDIVVVWRAWALWEGHTAIQWMLVTFGICNGVANIVDILFNAIAKVPAQSGSVVRQLSQNLFLVISLALNILATILIAYKTWIHANATRGLSSDRQKRSPSVNVLVFLLESGATFCILQVGYCTLSILYASEDTSLGVVYNLPLSASFPIVRYVAVMALGFYPTSVTLVSHLMLHRSSY